MGSSVGLALGNVFVGFNEKALLLDPNETVVYFHYVDNAFQLFYNETEADLFFNSLNKIHPALKFTLDKETDCTFSFLDVFIGLLYVISHRYCKPTFMGLYTWWDSFYPSNKKLI